MQVETGESSYGYSSPEIADSSKVTIKKVDLARSRLRPNLDLSGISKWKSLSHPNIMKCFNAYIEERFLCIEMEAFDGDNLIDFLWFQQRPLAQSIVVTIIQQIVSAIAYAQKQRILHGCLKTENIFLSKSFDVKISGFGISKALSKGWENYAPEVVKNQPYTAASEVWSVGCICYEILTLEPPFSDDNPFRLSSAILSTPIKEIEGDFSHSLKELILRMLDKNQNSRVTIDEASKILSSIQGENQRPSQTKLMISASHNYHQNTPTSVPDRFPKSPPKFSKVPFESRRDSSNHSQYSADQPKPSPYLNSYRDNYSVRSASASNHPNRNPIQIGNHIVSQPGSIEDLLRHRRIQCISFDRGNDFTPGTLVLTQTERAFLNTFKYIFIVTANSDAFLAPDLDPNQIVFLILDNIIKRIGRSCFSGMTNVESVCVFHIIYEVGDRAFFDCKSMINVTLPNTVMNLGISCLEGCSSLPSFIIPSSVLTLGDWCFYRCTNLAGLTLPKGLNKIGTHCFALCTKLFQKEGYIEIPPGAKYEWKVLRSYAC